MCNLQLLFFTMVPSQAANADVLEQRGMYLHRTTSYICAQVSDFVGAAKKQKVRGIVWDVCDFVFLNRFFSASGLI